MEKCPKISVIVPIYNVEAYLEKCLDSVINQTFTDIEIICVNDGSSDNSIQILEKYSLKDSRIQIINKDNGGLSSARNAGLKIAKGEFISFVDSDDWIEVHTLKTAIAKMTDDIDLVHFGAKAVCENEFSELENTQNYCEVKFIGKQNINPVLLENQGITAWSNLYRKEIIDKYNITFPNGLYFEDNEFVYKYYFHSRAIYCIKDYLYNYFQHENSIMYKSRYSMPVNHITDYLQIFMHLYKYLKEKELFYMYKGFMNSLLQRYIRVSIAWCPDKNKKTLNHYIKSMLKELDENDFDMSFLNKSKSHNNNPKKQIKSDINIPGFKKIFKTIRFLKAISGLNYPTSSSYQSVDLNIIKECRKTYNKIKNKGVAPTVVSGATLRHTGAAPRHAREATPRHTPGATPRHTPETAPRDGFCEIKSYNKEIVKELNNLSDFLFYPNFGNLGDVIIAQSEYQMFESLNYNYRILDKNNSWKILTTPFNLVYGGGGLFVNYWDYKNVLNIFKNPNLQKCIILPSSFWFCPDLLKFLDERFIVFCREKNSYEYCISMNKKAKFILADDMAFSLNLQNFGLNKNYLLSNLNKFCLRDIYVIANEIYPTYIKLRKNIAQSLIKNTVINKKGQRIAYFLRTDSEKQNLIYNDKNTDLSLFALSNCIDTAVCTILTKTFYDAINTVDIVITDRLHVGIMAALLRKSVILTDNSYRKVSGVYETSMKNFMDVKFVESLDNINIDTLYCSQCSVKTDILFEKEISFENFLFEYMYEFKMDNKMQNTIKLGKNER